MPSATAVADANGDCAGAARYSFVRLPPVPAVTPLRPPAAPFPARSRAAAAAPAARVAP